MSRSQGSSTSSTWKKESDIMSQAGEKWENYVEGSVWFYQPNSIAPPIFAVLFAISGGVHAWQTQHYKSWKMTLLIPWGALLMCVGFIMREVGAFRIDDLGILVASVVLTLAGPPVYAGADYFILGRTLYYIPWLSPVYPGRVVQVFIAADFIVEMLIGNGAARMANTSNSRAEREVGEIMVKVALLLQAVMFIIYVAILAIWHRRVKRFGLLTPKLRSVGWMLYASAVLITIRCIFRVVEFFEGYTGELYTHEVYFYVFEATLMLLNSVLLNVFHPGRYFPQKSKLYLATDGITEVKGPGWSDSRKWYVAIVDPFNIGGLFKKDKANENFWEVLIPAGEVDEAVESPTKQGRVQEHGSHDDGAVQERMPRSFWKKIGNPFKFSRFV
ncbi:RTA1-domain-containing protein [Polychaeton citri CBS 116435]|uniref:RTA1-domain-containing protein n=1 Tax=Polychaeton citri CBS 116435 TaxID=1314669 RepID=A0A9P4UQE6_9PEZI|nr:RTA1-domain-containing protein [Polychaeton citri CBS 116435]